MKVGIITQEIGQNYGGIMQNWALQQVLKSMGHYPITIDAYRRYPLYRWIYTSLKSKLSNVFGLRLIVSSNIPPKPIRGRSINRVSAPFIFNNILLSRPYASLSSDIITREKLDAIIVGSDQVWRPKYNPFLDDMFLGFALNEDVKRLSYAASFGTDEWEMTEEQTQMARELVQFFNKVSVREKSGVAICRDFLGINAELVLDPTLLLDSSRYLELCKDNKKDIRPYLAFYCLDLSDAKKAIAKQIALKYNLEVKEFSAGVSLSLTVEEWLRMFRDASYVLTDSFHGTVFSILFEKKFLTLCNKDRGASRFSSLFEQLNIKDHLLSENISWENVEGDLDWGAINSYLAELRKRSVDFINRSLGI